MKRIAWIFCLSFCCARLPAVSADEAFDMPQLTAEQAVQLQEAMRLIKEFNDLRTAGRHREALDRAERVLAICKSVFGPRHRHTLVAMERIGLCLTSLGDFRSARAHYQATVALSKQVHGPKNQYTGVTLCNYAAFLSDAGEYVDSRTAFEEALPIFKNALGMQNENTATALNNYGLLLQRMGDYEAALPVQEQVLALRKQLLGPHHAYTAASYGNLAVTLQHMGLLAAARPYFEASLSIKQATLGSKNPETAFALNNIGTFYSATGDLQAARDAYDKALSIWMEVFGSKHHQTANTLNNLGYVAQEMRDYATAQKCFEESLAIDREILGSNHPSTANALSNLGLCLQAAGDVNGARQRLEEALQIDKNVLGPRNPRTGTVLGNIGFLLRCEGEYAKARPYLEESLSISKETLGVHLSTAGDLLSCSLVEAGQENWAKAAELANEQRHMIRQYVSRVLPGLSATERIGFLQGKDSEGFQACLSLGLARQNDANIAALAAGWLANGKAVVQESLAEHAQMARESRNPKVAALIQQLLEVRRQLSGVALTVPGPGQEAARKQLLKDLEGKEQALSRELSSAEGSEFRAEPWVELNSIREQIPADGVLVDIARFSVVDFAAKGNQPRWRPARYVAWITPPIGNGDAKSDVRLVDLGQADVVDRALADMRTAMQAAIGTGADGFIQQLGEAEAERRLKTSLADLAKLVLAPLLPHLGEAKQVLLSPDSALWLAPWGALPLADGRFVIEAYGIRYLTSSRTLVARKDAKITTTKPIIMANPNFDLKPAEIAAATQAVFGKLNGPSNSDLRDVSEVRATRRNVARLPGTAVEAKAILPQLAVYTHDTPVLYADAYALEAVFKAVRRPKVVVLSTHGFFLEDQQAKPATGRESAMAENGPRTAFLTVDGKPIENPLLRCGLLLAGCNSSDLSSEEDGVLTGMEIVGSDLRGTELVVLSACQTGLGQVQNGEGVAGLRQAFQLAGANAVVATLWQIPDAESAQLMTTFFSNLAGGQSKAEALRNSQLAMIKQRRGANGAAHPFFWAAYTLTGQ